MVTTSLSMRFNQKRSSCCGILDPDGYGAPFVKKKYIIYMALFCHFFVIY